MTTTEYTECPVLWVEDDYDRERASDGVSRYGAYLLQRAARFIEDGLLIEDPAEFAAAAFSSACSPVMSPGYVRSHRRVASIDWCWDESEGNPGVRLELVAPHPPAVNAVLCGRRGGWQGWQSRGWGEARRWHEPDGFPGAFTTLTLRIPVEVAALPAPTYQGRYPELRTAKAAVRVVCAQVNQQAGPVLAALQDEGRCSR